MKNNYIIKSFLACILLARTANAQDIHFSQFSETPASINPALAGVRYNTSITANYKDQWGSVASKYQTYGLAF